MSKKELKQHKYAIFVTLSQLYLIKEFVDICSFLLMGKFEHPLWNLFISRDVDYHEFHDQAASLKRVVFPELGRNSWYGVGWTEGDKRQNDSQIAYEIQAQIAHELWKREPNRKPGGVRDHPPLHYSDEVLIRLADIETIEAKDRRIAELEAEIMRRDRIMESTLSICFKRGNVFSPASAKGEYWIAATTLGEITEQFKTPVEACEAYLKLEESAE